MIPEKLNILEDSGRYSYGRNETYVLAEKINEIISYLVKLEEHN